jgi:1-acyl-sn-glycerol-3-phosphate acyltransferase
MDWRDNFTWPTRQTPYITFWKYVERALFWPLYTVQWLDPENLPAAGPCILASNHISNFDSIVLWSRLPRRHIYFMAKIELFTPPIQRQLLARSGAFPVKRGESDEWALAQAGRVLAAGQMLGMFPEGTRSRNGRLQQGKLGAVKLALQHRVPLIPAAIQNTEQIRPGRGRVAVSVQIGRHLDITAIAGPPPHPETEFESLTTTLMRQIATMLPPNQRGRYG